MADVRQQTIEELEDVAQWLELEVRVFIRCKTIGGELSSGEKLIG